MREHPLQHREVAIEPELAIVDPHHHLWEDLTNPLATLYTLPELLHDLNGGHDVVGTVYLECTSHWYTSGPAVFRPVGETAWVAGLDLPDGVMGAIVGYADLRRGATARAVLEAHITAGRGKFAGVRHSVAWDPHPDVPNTAREVPPGTQLEPAFVNGVRLLGELGLSFDAWMYFHQLPELAQLAAQVETTIILDHLGGPVALGPYGEDRVGMLASWRENIRLVAGQENISLKIGGLGFPWFVPEEIGSTLTDSDLLASYWQEEVDFAIEAFGPDRVMFESNFPVDCRVADYVTLWNAMKKLARGYSVAEREKMFRTNAQAIYKLT